MVFRIMCFTCVMLFVSISLFVFSQPVHAAGVRVSEKEGAAIIENDFVKAAFDLTGGHYSIQDKRDSRNCLRMASVRLNQWKSTDEDVEASWQSRRFKDELGRGRRLCLTLDHPEAAGILFEMGLYEDRPIITMKAGLHNDTREDIRLHEIVVLEDAFAFPGCGYQDSLQILNGAAGGGHSYVTDTPGVSSANNLMLTFKDPWYSED